MIKKSVLFFIILNLFIINIKSDKNWDADKNPKKWIEYGEKNIKRMLERKFNGNIAKNVILFLGDGMGISTVS
jgi:alkaline phosphatase